MGVARKWIEPHSWFFLVWYKVHFLWHTFYVYFLHSLFYFCMSFIKSNSNFLQFSFGAFEHDFLAKIRFLAILSWNFNSFLMIYCKYCDWRDFSPFLKKKIAKKEFLTKLRVLQFCRLNLKFTYMFLVLFDPVGILSTLVC